MEPFTSERNLTPSSRGLLSETDAVAGTAELLQIVLLAYADT